MTEFSLQDRTIAVPETRELDIFAGLLERRGAKVIRCPLVAIHDAPDPQPVLAWIKRVIEGECDDLILLTGEGLRRLVSCIERNAPELDEFFIAALGRIRKITRGPKPAKALRELGLQSDLAAEIPTTDGVIALLSNHDLKHRRVGVQLYGSDPNLRLMNFLEKAGASTLPVAPYVYADSSEDDTIHVLAKQLQSGVVDAMAFTSMQQVQRWFDVLGDETAKAALAKTLIATVGPIVAESLRKRGVEVQIVPSDAFFLKPLTRALEEKLGSRPTGPG
ncbi:MAG TPA: uroporphyrinogen-III synthase [Steroidobacteraceae bacterium]|nr:uroporphyrinogen-III synthase [Steroidobacteraceae bacterium]